MIQTFRFERDDFSLEMNEKPTDFTMSTQDITDDKLILSSEDIRTVATGIPKLLRAIPAVFNTPELFCKVDVEITHKFPCKKYASGVSTIRETEIVLVTTMEGILLYHK